MVVAGLRSRLQTALSHVLEVKSHLGQRVVVDSSVKSEIVAALQSRAVDTQRQLRAVKNGIGNWAEAVMKIAQIRGRLTALCGKLLASLG